MTAVVPQALEQNAQLDTWIAVNADETITVRTGKVELGQGLMSGIARIAAEELDVELTRIRVETADTARGPDEQMTTGSQSMAQSGTSVRLVAAEARSALLESAATRLGAALADLDVVDGTVTDRSGGGVTTYWEVQGGRPFDRLLSGTVRPKPPEQHSIVGKPGDRIDLEAIVTGRTRYVQDLAPPGVMHARVVRPPSAAARLESLELDRADGATVVRDGGFLAVLADREEDAVSARSLVAAHAKWAERPTLPPRGELREWLLGRPSLDFMVVDGVGKPDDPIEPHVVPSDAAHTIEATFTRPYQMHASLGPSAALALWEDSTSLTVWTHSQGISLLRISLAQVLELDPGSIRVVHVPGPGCYGHNGADDAALDAALAARAVPGRPVLLKWMRDDENAWEPFGPAMVVKTSASVDRSGRGVDWNLETWSQTHIARPRPAAGTSGLLASWHREKATAPTPVQPYLFFHAGSHRNADPIYDVGRRRIVKHLVPERALRTSALRSLGAYANVFAIESTIDELAQAAATDPIEFRLRHLDDERAHAVLEAAAERADWGAKPAEFGSGRGVGFARYKNTHAYAAVIADVLVDDDSAAIRLVRAIVAADAGEVIDPDGLANQLEGGVVQSASWTLKEEVMFDDTRVTSTDWETYPILTFMESPELETVLIDRPGEPFLGAGEATQGPTAAAIANAVFDAVGVRLRDIPFTPERLRQAAATQATV